MPQDRTMTRRKTKAAEPIAAESDPPGGGPSPLLEQTAAYANIARDALENCERGADAEQELHKRRNRSGQ